MIFYSHANKTRFHQKGFALRLVLKVRIFGTRKCPKRHLHISHNAPYLHPYPLPPQKKKKKNFFQDLCFSFLPGITAVPR